jgi:adenosylcobinamide-GDP ribazoletransferase
MIEDNQPEDVVDARGSLPLDTPKVVVGGKSKESSEDTAKTIPPSTSEDKDEKSNSNDSEKKKGSSKKSIGPIFGSLKAMISFFTIIRVDVNEHDVDSMESNFWLAPVAGLFVGLFAAIVGLILWGIGFNTFVVSVMMLATVYIVSKFLHFDGLVDFGDALVATGDREKRVKALKDTAIGAGGFGIALIVVLITVSMLTSMGTLLVVLFWPVEVLIKNAMVAAAAWGEPGNGMAAKQVSKTNFNSIIISSVLAFAMAVVALLIGGGACQLICGFEIYSADMMWKCLVLLVVGLVFSILAGIGIAEIANRKIGFVNGDVLGATNEISRAVILFFMMIAGFGLGMF